MSLRKLGLFTMLATIVAFAAVARLSIGSSESNLPTSSSRPKALAPDGALLYPGDPANKSGRYGPEQGTARRVQPQLAH